MKTSNQLKNIFFILIFILLLNAAKANNYFCVSEPTILINIQDTSKDEEIIEDSLINEVIKSKSEPQKEKVQYLSQLTRYGFKNLFTQFNYNPSLPYSSQVNPNAELYMQDYLRTHQQYLLKMKLWAIPYFNLIDNIFTQYGLPRELKYLAVIESSLQTGATSWVGAAGPWQFMPETARRYGLKVDRQNDERRDYFKSTHAAAHFLLTLYSIFHDWLLVIAAYNGGAERVNSAIKQSGSKDFWTLQYHLPQESRNHVKKFIATHFIMENNSTVISNDNKSISQDPLNPYDNKSKLSNIEKENAATQTISGKYISKIIAKNLSMEMNVFNNYNPDFDSRISQNGQFDLRLPKEKMELFIAIKYQILNECVELMLGDNEVPVSKTTYPSTPHSKNKKTNH